jgi:GNAT superfamily N-acetyltransferase
MGIPEGFTIRRASTDDMATIVAHRRGMFYDMGYHDEAALDLMSAKFQPWALARMNSGEYLAWLVADTRDSVVASAGLWLMDWPPHMLGSGTRRGYILNVFTEREFRRGGLSRHLMEIIIEWCRGNGIDTVVLHASSLGRALYESLGFKDTNEMRMTF